MKLFTKRLKTLPLALLSAFAAIAQTVTLAPAPGSTMKSIKEIDFSYKYMVNAIDTEKVYFTNTATGERTQCNGFSISYSPYFMLGGTMEFPAITEPGTYELTMESGAVQPWFATDPTNDPLTAQYFVSADAEEITIFSSYSLTPEFSETAMLKLNQVQIYFPKITYYDTVEIDTEKVKEITLVGPDKTFYAAPLNGYYGTYVLKFTDKPGGTSEVSVTEPGEYELTLPAGLFTNGAVEPADLVASPEIKGKYVISDNIEFSYACAPENGTVNYLKAGATSVSPRIYFGYEVSAISLDPYTQGAKWNVELNGQPLNAVADVNKEEGYFLEQMGVSVYINLSPSLISGESVFHITADKGAFTVDGIASPAIDYTVTYCPPKEFTFGFNPMPNTAVPSFSELTVFFTNAETAEKPYYCQNSVAKMTSVRPGSEPVSSVDITINPADDTSDCPYMVIAFEEAFRTDNYIFSFPAGKILLDNEDNPAIEAIFRVDSNLTGLETVAGSHVSVFSSSAGLIEILNPERTVVDVYDMEGKRIARTSADHAFITAASGLYVVKAEGLSYKLIVK